ncbi:MULTISPECIES: hypothetical protein [unclassified Streptomyces]|uniref:hypothetical protein n=1 Tax=unclassified Streptomyces TaxID=2593676 RepID=UPI000DC7B3E0|nr:MULTISPECIES: hypothetical protein [unclassified Streptomyces]AWZ04303.1 hypothetical protein DRB89_06295 [Streptomyces sp. ICC4]AWZ12413.1 hypothetical protein DRB96_08845 [Streptomyces sp. ICC1]
MSISVPGVLARNSLALAAEFAAVLLLRGDPSHWLPVMLVLFAFVSGVPNGTEAGFVLRTVLAGGAVLIVWCGVRAGDEVPWQVLTGVLALIQTVVLTRISRR